VQDGLDGAELVLAAVDGSLEGLERCIRQGRATLAVLEPQGAAQVAPCLRAGAVDCLVRPLDGAKTAGVIKRCLELGQLAQAVAEQEDRLWRDLPGTRLVGESPALAAALGEAVQAASFPVDVLILGETGTGKELLARVIHERSGQRLGPFVAVDCGAINPDLADSALFGHRRGAFTGAHQDHVGLLEQADGGILFLDEVANLSQAVQAKLLRALQNREIWRLGDTVAKPVEFRVLAATHADLEREVAEGRFRSDLYHRLADLKVQLPPLRERGGDVELLARLFLGRHRSRYGLDACSISAEALDLLRRHDWPGNVRQLDNALKQAALLAGEVLQPEHLPQEVQAGPAARPAAAAPAAVGAGLAEGLMPLWQLEQSVTRQVESRAIQAALAQAGQDRDKAAAILELHPKTLARKMKLYDL
jgi:two-component system, NtrC family, response regulator HydG